MKLFVYSALKLFNQLTMKKSLLFIAALTTTVVVNAQTTALSASGLADFQTWSIVDADGDTFNWGIYDLAGAGTSFDAQGEVAGSQSYDNTAGTLTPDNWLISPMFDLAGLTSAEVSWGRGATDASFPAENYSVYVVTGADITAAITALATATPVYNETIAVGDEWLTRNQAIGSFDNMSNLWLAFRHHDCTDQFFLIIDDIEVTGTGTAGLVESSIEVNAFPNPASSELTVSVKGDATSVSIISMDGKVVSTQDFVGASTTMNVSELIAGVYFYEVTAADGSVIRNTFVKK